MPAPSASRRWQPWLRSLVHGPGTANTSVLISAAKRAVCSAPDARLASTTTTALAPVAEAIAAGEVAAARAMTLAAVR